jgi:hypothetical protein
MDAVRADDDSGLSPRLETEGIGLRSAKMLEKRLRNG